MGHGKYKTIEELYRGLNDAGFMKQFSLNEFKWGVNILRELGCITFDETRGYDVDMYKSMATMIMLEKKKEDDTQRTETV